MVKSSTRKIRQSKANRANNEKNSSIEETSTANQKKGETTSIEETSTANQEAKTVNEEGNTAKQEAKTENQEVKPTSTGAKRNTKKRKPKTKAQKKIKRQNGGGDMCAKLSYPKQQLAALLLMEINRKMGAVAWTV